MNLLPAGPAVPIAWLAKHQHEKNLRILDVRLAEAYVEGHIPRASHLELKDARCTRDGVEGMVLETRDFAALAGKHGIDRDSVVILYDDNLSAAAARLAWSFHYYGHQQVALLDGGWDAWEAAGYPVSHDAFRPEVALFEPSVQPQLLADLAYIQNTSTLTLLDTRSQAEFDKGHLPGAHHWNWENGSSFSQSFCHAEALLDFLKTRGISLEDEIITYCQSGVRASHTFFLLKQAGFKRVRLYDGSWAEWSKKVVDTCKPLH